MHMVYRTLGSSKARTDGAAEKAYYDVAVERDAEQYYGAD